MEYRKSDGCLWHVDVAAESSLGSLQAILNCASIQGCRDCVTCSERALELFLRTARATAGNFCS